MPRFNSALDTTIAIIAAKADRDFLAVFPVELLAAAKRLDVYSAERQFER